MKMDTLLGGLAFAMIIFGQFAAIIAVHGEKTRRDPDTSALPHLDDCARLVWHGS